MNGFCSRDECTPLFTTKSWTLHDVRESLQHTHVILTAQQAVHLVSEHVGVAILTRAAAVGSCAEGVVVKPLSETSLCFETCVTMRSDDDSRLTNEFARMFLSRSLSQRLPPKQVKSSPSAQVLSWKMPIPPSRP